MTPRLRVGGALAGGLLLLFEGCAPGLPPAAGPSPCGHDAAAEPSCAAVGYGVQPRRTTTGASGAYIVDPRDLAGVSRVEQLLEGHVPGVWVDRLNGEYVVRIRGRSGEPLVVVDGIPTPINVSTRMALGGIIPGTVARIDVLKGANAAATYGIRGVDGVILITTRRSR